MKYNVSKIRELICVTGMNETDFLHSVGLGSKTLSRWEDGTEIPRDDYASYIAGGLGVDVSDIFLGEEGQVISLAPKKTIAEALVDNYITEEGLITSNQIGAKEYLHWIALLDSLNHSGERLIDSYLENAFMQSSEQQILYQFTREIFSLIGKVNGSLLRYDETTAKTMIEYAWAKRHEQELYVKFSLHNRDEVFRLMLERYLARRIIVQKAKTPTMISDDQKDFELRRKLRNYQNRKRKKAEKSFAIEEIKTEKLGAISSKNEVKEGDKAKSIPVQPTTEPKSTILAVKLCMQGTENLIDILIVSDEREQKASEGVYWVGRVLPSILLIAIQAKERVIYYNGDAKLKKGTYEIVDSVAYRSASKYMRIVARFSDAEAPQTVYVFSQKNLEKNLAEHCEMVTAMIPCANRRIPIPVSVYYDKQKKKYFLNATTYEQLRRNYGLPYLRIQTTPSTGASTWITELRPHSELNLLGYNVKAVDSLSLDERRKILCDAIDGGVLWKSEVINHLEWLIRMGEKNPLMEGAVGEWKQDLMYISNYKANEQRKVWINKFKSRFTEKPVI